MKRIDIKVAFECNNNCKFCVRREKDILRPDKNTYEIKSILRESRYKYGEVVFTGGEPTIRSDIINLVSYACNLGYKIHIQSNGRMFFYKDFSREMVYAGAGIFSISLHGHNAEVHDYLTGIQGSFLQTRQGLENLLSLGAVVLVNTVITKNNFRFLPHIAKLLVNLGIRQYQLAFPHIQGMALANKSSVVPSKKEVMPYVGRAIEIGLKAKCLPFTEAIPYCILGKYSDYAAENNIINTKVFDTLRVVEDFNRWRKAEGKSKCLKCRECRYFKSCEGPWREYPYFYGWNEFKPVK